MIEQRVSNGTSASGPLGWVWAVFRLQGSALAIVAACAMLLAACGTAPIVEDSRATNTPTTVTSMMSGSSGRDHKVIRPSLVGAESGTSTPFPESGNGGYDVTSYDWDLAVSDDRMSLSGVSRITAVTTQNLERFSLDSRGLQIESVTVDEVPVDFYVTRLKLVITTAKALSAGSEFVVEAAYSAEPSAYVLDRSVLRAWDLVPAQQVFIASLPRTAATWMPVNEDVSAPWAQYVMRFDPPVGLTATAIGIPTEEHQSAQVVWETSPG